MVYSMLQELLSPSANRSLNTNLFYPFQLGAHRILCSAVCPVGEFFVPFNMLIFAENFAWLDFQACTSSYLTVIWDLPPQRTTNNTKTLALPGVEGEAFFAGGLCCHIIQFSERPFSRFSRLFASILQELSLADGLRRFCAMEGMGDGRNAARET